MIVILIYHDHKPIELPLESTVAHFRIFCDLPRSSQENAWIGPKKPMLCRLYFTVFTCMYVCMYVGMCVCVCVYVHTYVWDPKRTSWESYRGLLTSCNGLLSHPITTVQPRPLTHPPRNMPWSNNRLRGLTAKTIKLFNSAKRTG
jgi:hypothetical protein